MPDVTEEAGRSPLKPASIPVRVIAFALDVLIVKLLLLLIVAAIAFLVSDRVRLAIPVMSTVTCKPTNPPSNGLTTPNGTARLCTQSLFGLARNDRIFTRLPASATDDERIIEQAVDRNGHPVGALNFDEILPLLLALYFVALEWRYGTTVAQWLVATLVKSSTTQGPINLTQAIKRTVTRLAVLLPFAMETSVKAPEGQSWRFTIDLAISRIGSVGSLAISVLQLLALGFIVYLIIAAVKDWPPLHDRWAGTTVVREFPN